MSFSPQPSPFLRRGSVPVTKTRLQRVTNGRLGCSGKPERPTCSSFLGLPNLLCQRAVNPTSNRSGLSAFWLPANHGLRRTHDSTRNLEAFEPAGLPPIQNQLRSFNSEEHQALSQFRSSVELADLCLRCLCSITSQHPRAPLHVRAPTALTRAAVDLVLCAEHLPRFSEENRLRYSARRT